MCSQGRLSPHNRSPVFPQIEPFTGTRAQATARKRPAEAEAGAAASSVLEEAAEVSSSFVSPISKRRARGVLFPEETPMSPAAAGKPFAPGLRDVTNVTPERLGAAAGGRKPISKRMSTAAVGAGGGSGEAAAAAKAKRATRSSMPAAGRRSQLLSPA